MKDIIQKATIFVLLTATVLLFSSLNATAYTPETDRDTYQPQRISSPFEAPEKNDTTFVVDEAPGLDTGCSFRGEGPLIFEIEIDRYIGDRDKLLDNDLLPEEVTLRMPAYDVDYDYVGSIQPERDQVLFNGNVVPTEFLTGANNVWKLNTFNIPIDWIKFPKNPADTNGVLEPEMNTIQINIDTANPTEEWCTAIDWAALSIELPRPIFMVHGIKSDGGTWNDYYWTPKLNELGLPSDTIDMGYFDGIQDNAEKIAAKVEELQEFWGVEKINIVAHSKGGLDSRHYIENNPSVETLVQIGTPNAGSPVADAVQRGAISTLGLMPTIILDSLVGEASYQLTTIYMQGYNLIHGSNSESSYVVVGGNYKFGGWGIVDGFFYLLNNGDNDMVVPVWSAYSLPYTTNIDHNSSESDKTAQHTELNKNEAVFEKVDNFLFNSGSANRSGSTNVNQNQRGLSSSVPEIKTTGSAISKGETIEHQFVVSGDEDVMFMLYFTGTALSWEIESPSMEQFTENTLDSNFEFHQMSDEKGVNYLLFGYDDAEPGTWKIKVTEPNAINETEEKGYFISAWEQSTNILMVAQTETQLTQLGDDIVISAELTNNSSPISNATVTAKAVTPQENISNITLLDNGSGADETAGDGIYTGVLADVAEAGFHQIVISATGPNSLPFEREQYLLTQVSSSDTSLESITNDFGRDTNFNTLFDELVVEVEVDVTETVQHRAFGVLNDSNGNQIATTSSELPTTVGPHTIELIFNGNTIFENGVDGPYSLAVVRLTEEIEDDAILIDETAASYQTQAYSYRDFERPVIYISGEGEDRAIDLGSDSLFDVLEIDLNIEVLTNDVYQWTALLVDTENREIDFTSGSGFLDSSEENTIQFSFDGSKIGQNGKDGPFYLANLLIFGSSSSQVVFQGYETSAYECLDFSNALCPQLSVLDNDGELLNDGDSLEFGTTDYNEPVSQRFEIQNTGTATLTIDSITIPVGFSLISPMVANLSPNERVELELQLDGNQIGPVSGILRIDVNDQSESPFTLLLEGEVRPPKIYLPILFGN